AEATVEVPETGSSLKANNLRIVAELLQSTPRFIANAQAVRDPWKKSKMDDMLLMLQGAMAAEGKVGLMLNAKKSDLPAVLKILPALQNPTISSLSDEKWVAVNTIIDESTVRHIIPQLKQAGATGIVEYPLNSIIAGCGLGWDKRSAVAPGRERERVRLRYVCHTLPTNYPPSACSLRTADSGPSGSSKTAVAATSTLAPACTLGGAV